MTTTRELPRAAGSVFEIVKALANAVYDDGGSDESLRLLISNRWLRKQVAQRIVNPWGPVYGAPVLYHLLFETRLKMAGILDHQNSGYDSRVFSKKRRDEYVKLVIADDLGHVHSLNVGGGLHERGLRAATIDEAVALAQLHPELIRKEQDAPPLIAFASAYRPHSNYLYPALLRNERSNAIELRLLEGAEDGFLDGGERILAAPLA